MALEDPVLVGSDDQDGEINTMEIKSAQRPAVPQVQGDTRVWYLRLSLWMTEE